jgi:hypothetical protein
MPEASRPRLPRLLRRNRALAGLALLSALATAVDVSAENIDPPGGPDEQYAWGENVGWVNAEPQGDGGPGVQVDDFRVTGWMWGENAGWIHLSCDEPKEICEASEFGVANNGNGKLQGWAWGENVGWVSFACDDTASCNETSYGVTIDPLTGNWGGQAWAENVGWINFGCSTCNCRTTWCQSTSTPPAGQLTNLTLSKLGSDSGLDWAPGLSDATWYDVVWGDLSELRSSGGDFGSGTAACLTCNVVSTSVVASGPPAPAPGEGQWFLVRGANCKGDGTYDATGGEARDPGITASTNDCTDINCNL